MMKVLLVSAIATCFAVPALAQQVKPDNPYDTQAFTRELRNYFRLLALPGMSVAVVKDGKIIYRLNQGYSDVEKKVAVDDESIFALASVTKGFTGVMMMQYEQEAKISLDDYLLSYPFDSNLFSPHLVDPDTRLKHVLSMTSGGVPGTTFSYNGGRFNLLTGVFEKTSGRDDPRKAYATEVETRILLPLHMKSTFDGWAEGPSALKARVVKRYDVAQGKEGPVFTDVPYDSNAAWPAPAAGLFSSVGDLAVYAAALDDDRLIPHTSYVEMTSPFPHGQRREIPYGFGWLTQEYRGIKLDWTYGEGSQDSALFLRVPERKLTFIFLSNSGFPSHASRLQNGNILRSPFALAFLKHFLLDDKRSNALVIDYDRDIETIKKELFAAGKDLDPVYFEELYTQALIRAYMRDALHADSKQPEALTKLLYELHPQTFDSGDTPLIVMLFRIDVADLHDAADRWIRSLDISLDFRPEAIYFVGKYYEKIGDTANAMKYFRLLADSPRFVDEGAKIDACLILGRYYIKQGDVAKGREYIWKSALAAWDAHWQPSYLTDMLSQLGK